MMDNQNEQNSPFQDGWLIERFINETSVYLTVSDGAFNWTTDLNKALRFKRRQDCEMLSEIIGEDVDRIAEHSWSGGPVNEY